MLATLTGLARSRHGTSDTRMQRTIGTPEPVRRSKGRTRAAIEIEITQKSGKSRLFGDVSTAHHACDRRCRENGRAGSPRTHGTGRTLEKQGPKDHGHATPHATSPTAKVQLGRCVFVGFIGLFSLLLSVSWPKSKPKPLTWFARWILSSCLYAADSQGAGPLGVHIRSPPGTCISHVTSCHFLTTAS